MRVTDTNGSVSGYIQIRYIGFTVTTRVTTTVTRTVTYQNYVGGNRTMYYYYTGSPQSVDIGDNSIQLIANTVVKVVYEYVEASRSTTVTTTTTTTEEIPVLYYSTNRYPSLAQCTLWGENWNSVSRYSDNYSTYPSGTYNRATYYSTNTQGPTRNTQNGNAVTSNTATASTMYSYVGNVNSASKQNIENSALAVSNNSTVYYRYTGTNNGTYPYYVDGKNVANTYLANNCYHFTFGANGYELNLSTDATGSVGNGTDSLDSILDAANATLGTPNVIYYYGNYYAYNGSTITTATGNTYVNGRIYRLLIKDGAFYFASVDDPEFDLVDDTFEEVTNITDLQTLTLNGSQDNIGKIYYYTGATDRTYETMKFYIMSYNTVTGTYYLKRFGAIDSNITNTAFRLSNERLYDGNNYGGTGGTEEVIISATVYVNGEEYVRKFLVTVIG
jgi:hypothetical protein